MICATLAQNPGRGGRAAPPLRNRGSEIYTNDLDALYQVRWHPYYKTLVERRIASLYNAVATVHDITAFAAALLLQVAGIATDSAVEQGWIF
jgi:hypothetical protein